AFRIYTAALGYGPFTTSNPANPRGDRGNCLAADVRHVFSEIHGGDFTEVFQPCDGNVRGQMETGDFGQSRRPLLSDCQSANDQALVGTPGVQWPNQIKTNVYLPNKGQNGWL